MTIFGRFLNGLVFGAGFSLAFVIVWFVSFYIMLPRYWETKYENAIYEDESESVATVRLPNKTHTVPVVPPVDQYVGTSGVYTSGFEPNSSVLSGGPGRIVGSVVSNGQPVEGLKLRLALNGSVYSQWAVSDVEGVYKIEVPYGTYKIYGFDIDHASANKVLPNKIDHPAMAHSSDEFDVMEGNPGHGLRFEFVEPVKKKFQKQYSISEAVVLEWESYPFANEYEIQIYEKSDPYRWSNDTLFKWGDRPTTLEPKLDLSKHTVNLKPGFFYLVRIEARDEQRRVLSQTAESHSSYDFEVVD